MFHLLPLSHTHSGTTKFTASQHLLTYIFLLRCIRFSSNISSLWSSVTGQWPVFWSTGTKFRGNRVIPTSWWTKTLAHEYHITHQHIPEDHNLNIQCCDNHQYHVILTSFSSVVSSNYERLWWSRGSVLLLSNQVRGFKPGRSRQDFSGRKYLQHAFNWKGSKVADLRHVKDPWIDVEVAISGKITG